MTLKTGLEMVMLSFPGTTEGEYLEYVNRFSLQFVEDTRCLTKVNSVVVDPAVIDSGGQTQWSDGSQASMSTTENFILDLPQDCIYVNELRIYTSAGELADSLFIYRIRDRRVEFYDNFESPIKKYLPGKYRIELHYVRRPQVLDSLSSSFDLPEELHMAPVANILLMKNLAIGRPDVASFWAEELRKLRKAGIRYGNLQGDASSWRLTPKLF